MSESGTDRIVNDSLRPERFLARPPGRIRIDRAGSRWRIWLDHSDPPLDLPTIEVSVESGDRRIVVARNIAMRVGGSMREIVGTVPLDRGLAVRAIERLLERTILFALTGTSRLPITSVETPHPLFTLGMLAYLPAHVGSPVEPGRTSDAHHFEARLRMNLPIDSSGPGSRASVLGVFNQLALSPYTSVGENLVHWVLALGRQSAVELLGYMLRHLSRHLSAFDLVKFHNQGANYPDALMLDLLLRAYIPLLDEGATMLDRRALRQGWLARKRCEGLLVPDHPTSPGDNVRQLPYPPVPQAHLTEPTSRTRRLFANEPAEALLTPIAQSLLHQSVDDLSNEAELRELGTATFLDRPIGAIGKRPREPDGTTLLSYEACSNRMIAARLRELWQLGLVEEGRFTLPAGAVGYPVGRMAGHPRQGVVSLEDAKKVALDFVVTRTTNSSLLDLVRKYDFSRINGVAPRAYGLMAGGRGLLIRTSRNQITFFDLDMTPLLRFAAEPSGAYFECGGIEYAEGLCAIIDEDRIPLPPRLDG
jgi:hypothetical protein